VTTKTRRFAWTAPVLAFGLLAAACGDDTTVATEGTSDAATGGSGGGGASGSVLISGSSTVEPISIRVAELLEEQNDQIMVDVDGPGTGDGFQLFCNGETDISDASRAIKPEEAEVCEANEIDFIELYVAIDGLAVLTSSENDAVECLSFADMYGLVGPESTDVDTWSDASSIASELGSSTELPDARLDISAPGAESGTYDSFIELALAGPAEERGQDEATRNFPGQADDNIILQGIEGSPSSFGWVGYAYAAEAADQVKLLEVSEEPDGTCVAPTEETIASGEYPLSRPLLIYVNADRADENPALAEYVDFYLNDGMAAVSEVGYVDIPESDLEAVRERWESRTTGTELG
jgi:phosphate transport system substrate-binding protein